MGTYGQIDAVLFRSYLKKRNLTQTELAKKLKVSLKTVQRWANGKVLQVRLDTLQEVAQILAVPMDELMTSRAEVHQKSKDPLLKVLLSSEIRNAFFSTKRWESYTALLEQFEKVPLSSDQRVRLYTKLGYIAQQLGKCRTARNYLNHALSIAEGAKDVKSQIRISYYLSINALSLGFINQSDGYLKSAQRLNELISAPELKAEGSYYQAKIALLAKSDFTSAQSLLRRSLVLEMRSPGKVKNGLSIKYIQLARIALRQNELTQALKYYSRAEKHSYSNNVRLTEAVAHYGQAIVLRLQGEAGAADIHLKKARLMVGGKRHIYESQKLMGIEFIFALWDKQFDLCRLLLQRRYLLNRRSKVMIVNTVKAALVLQHSDRQYKVRSSWLLRADTYAQQMKSGFGVEQYLQLRHSTDFEIRTPEDIFKYLLF